MIPEKYDTILASCLLNERQSEDSEWTRLPHRTTAAVVPKQESRASRKLWGVHSRMDFEKQPPFDILPEHLVMIKSPREEIEQVQESKLLHLHRSQEVQVDGNK
jgi:hypothetical protein